MKKYASKLIALFLAVVMVVSSITPTALAAPAKSDKAAASEEIVLSDNTKAIIKAAKAMAAINKLGKEQVEDVSAEKEAVKDGIFHNYDEETDLSEYDITSKEMEQLVDEVLEENHMEATVEVEYETDADDKVTSMSVEMDSLVAQAGEESSALTDEQREQLMGKYSQYMSYMQQNADLFGVQTPYFTNKDKVCPIGSLLAIAGIPNQYLALGLDFVIANIMSVEEVTGVVDLFHYANVFTVEMKSADLKAARDEALSAVKNARTDMQKHLELNDWLAQNCTFDMPYIMDMTAPEEDTESAMYKDRMAIFDAMYENIKQQVYDGYYQYLIYQEGYPEETAAQVAEMMAKSYMDDPTEDGSDNGAASAMTLAVSIINLWEGNHVGALTYGTAVCLGYSNAYVYLVQSLYTNIYKNSDGTWKTYEQLNNGSNGNWSAIVDYVRITFDAEVTMYGVTQENFQSDHYWNAVKIDGKWYYVDPCYTDVYVEVMARDRVETNGNMNHLYFLFSHNTAEELYEDYYSELDTLYKGIATDTKYEEAWVAFAKSPVYRNSNTYYYLYDSTDIKEMQDNYEMTQDDIEYKLVSKNAGSSNSADAAADYDKAYVDFKNGQVLDPDSGNMVDNPIIKKYYDEHETYKEDYSSIAISVAYYSNKLYFNMSNCIFSYDLNSGDVRRLIEYNKVTAERDMTKAFAGMSFTESSSEGDYGVTVKNPPIAGMTIRDGEMTVDIATSFGYISGKKSHVDSDDEPSDTSSYGYMFEETHFNEEYLYASYSDMGGMMGDTDNDNDEFMWSANIYETIDMSHLTGSHSSYSSVSVEATCTDDSYSERRCSTCGLIQEASAEDTVLKLAVVDAEGEEVEGYEITDTVVVSSTEEDYISSSFTAEEVREVAEDALAAEIEAGEIEIIAIEMPESISWKQEDAVANVVVKEAEKTTPITVNFVKEDGTAVTINELTKVDVVSTANALEDTAATEVKAAVDEVLATDTYKVLYQLAGDNAIAISGLTWGSSGTATVTLKDVVTTVTVTISGSDSAKNEVKVDTLTINTDTATTAAEAIKTAVTEAVTEKINATTPAAYAIAENGVSVPTDAAWGGSVEVTVTLTDVELATTYNVTVSGAEFTVDPIVVTKTKSAFVSETEDASALEAAKTAAAAKFGEKKYNVNAEVTTSPAWGGTGEITVSLEEIKDTVITVKVEGASVTVDPITVTTTQALFEEKTATLADDAKSLVETALDDNKDAYTMVSTVTTAPTWGGTGLVTVTLTETTAKTSYKTSVTGADGITVEGITVDDYTTEELTKAKYNEQAATLQADAEAKAKVAVETAVAAKYPSDEYENVKVTVSSTKAEWGKEGTITATVTATAITKITIYETKVNPVEGIDTITVEPYKTSELTKAEYNNQADDIFAAAKDAAKSTVESAVKTDLSTKYPEKTYDVSAAVTANKAAWGATETITVEVTVTEKTTTETEIDSQSSVIATAEGDTATATLNIKIDGQSEQPAALTATGAEGDVHVFSASEIETAINEVLADGSELHKDTIISERAVAYGSSKTITITLRNDETNHQYVQFKETYYTKSGNNWNTGTVYVCIKCKDAVEDKPANVLSVNKNNMSKVWTWAGDFSAASVYRVPSSYVDVMLDCIYENPSIGSSREVASSITKTLEGYCDEGVTWVYTATAGSDTNTQRDKQDPTPHQYIADEIVYTWNADYTRCDISYKCSFCGKTGTAVCEGDAIKVDYVEPTCTIDGKTIYTASVTLEGATYTNSQEIFNENKAFGHSYKEDKEKGDEFCTRCGQVKPDSKITLPKSYRAAYTGKAVTSLKKKADVEGSAGKVTIRYYTDEKCKNRVTKDHGASKKGAAPAKIGIYYAKATVDADDQYKTATSKVCKFIICPNEVTNLTISNSTSGIYLKWKKVKEASGYYIYRREPNGTYEKIATLKKNSTVKYTDKTAKAGQTYEYDVRSYAKASGTSIRTFINADGISLTRSILKGTNTRTNGVSLSWTKVPGAKTYKVYRKAIDSEDKYTRLATVEGETAYKDKTAKNGVTYKYYVKPDNTGRTTVLTKRYLKNPTIKSLTAASKTKLTVKWSKNAKADGYEIRYSTSESFSSYKTIKVTSKNTLTKSITGLTKNKKYYVKVRAYDKYDGKTYYSAWTTASSVKTKK